MTTAGNECAIEFELRAVARELDEVRVRRIALIARARSEGTSWPRIGKALGITDVAARRLHARNR